MWGPEHVLKVEPAGLGDGSYMGSERKRELKEDPTILGWRNCKDGIASNRDEKGWFRGDQDLGFGHVKCERPIIVLRGSLREKCGLPK